MTLPISPTFLENKLNLIYCSDNEAGFTRRKWGRGFQYLDDNNQKLNCQQSLQRIKQMAIPPMWGNVWICKKENGHLQSTGRDLRRRKQYIYHPDWITYRQAEKFSKMIDFAEGLPQLRKTVEAHLKNKTWNRNKVLALAVKVLDEHHIRIGNRQYAKKNETFGLTTLRRKHIKVDDNELIFSYKAKSNKHRNISIDNPKLIRLIRKCSELPGYEVFTYRDKSGLTQSINSSDVNDYIHQIMGNNFSAKDFRTWGGTSYAVKFFPAAKEIVSQNPRKKLEKTIVKLVAKELGNTISVCRKYYIHPCVLDAVQKKQIGFSKIKSKKYLDDYEVITKTILQKYC